LTPHFFFALINNTIQSRLYVQIILNIPSRIYPSLPQSTSAILQTPEQP
jgi:hypothetical protein